jgi:hypothetical protein
VWGLDFISSLGLRIGYVCVDLFTRLYGGFFLGSFGGGGSSSSFIISIVIVGIVIAVVVDVMVFKTKQGRWG